MIEGTTASFAKELTRRAILLAALEGRNRKIPICSRRPNELMSDAASLTRSLLGGTGENEQAEGTDPGSAGYVPGIAPRTFGWSDS